MAADALGPYVARSSASAMILKMQGKCEKEWQCSWQAVLCDAPKVLAILDHFYDPELLQNSTEVRS